MNTSVDSNVFVALWDSDASLSDAAQRALDLAGEQREIVVCAPVYSELLANRGRDEKFLDGFFEATNIQIDWVISEAVWRAAGLAFAHYAERRKKHGIAGPRKILADFLIGAHADVHRYHLLTADDRFFRTAFPSLVIVKVLPT